MEVAGARRRCDPLLVERARVIGASQLPESVRAMKVGRAVIGMSGDQAAILRGGVLQTSYARQFLRQAVG